VAVHDIGLRMHRNLKGEPGWEVVAGGGQGRTPMIAVTVREFLPERDLLPYLEAIMRVYNLHGRRDNKYKARIKILVHELGADAFRRQVEDEYARLGAPSIAVEARELARIAAYFEAPDYEDLPDTCAQFELARNESRAFAQWARVNVAAHKQPGYAIVNISLKPAGGIPGDASADEMDLVADLAEAFSFGEIRVSHRQNLVLPYVRKADLHTVWSRLRDAGLGVANLGHIGDIVACPGMDYCSLATARSIPVSQAISKTFADLKRQYEIGPLTINISGCINACGHHHVGHIGILGLDKKGKEYYQITLGGSSDETASIGSILGPGFSAEEVTGAIETIVETYIDLRGDGETFLQAYRRVGARPFKEALYATA
jgi:sulfite reductase (NADPH) hemoprotein beta-component